MTDDESRNLFDRICTGDEQAADELFDRFVDRLIALARSRLSPRLASRFDPEDIVQSAFRSFFRNACGGRYELRQSRDLWRLLAAVTMNKLQRQVERHMALRRTVLSESSRRHEALSHDPSPEEAAILVEETELLMSRLSARYRQILQLRLQGFSIEETSKQVDCTERTVHRAMEFVRNLLEERMSESIEA